MECKDVEKVSEELKNQKLEEEPVEKQEQKPTQTDHVNRKLLGSFLDRLNQNDNSVAFALNSTSSEAVDVEKDSFSDDAKEVDTYPETKFEKQEQKPTQTDHVNRKLLGSFLDRLNQNDNSIAFALNSTNSEAEEVENDLFSGDSKEVDTYSETK